MARYRNTETRSNDLASDYHRILGYRMYSQDIDMMMTEIGNKEEMFYEFTGNGNPVAMIDYKYPGQRLSDKHFSIQGQINIANRLEIPFFFAITYLDVNHPIKMYYVIPINKLAREFWIETNRKPLPGAWLTLRQFSQFEHALRSMPWNPAEPIPERNLEAVQLQPGMTLGDLPNVKAEYPLPQLDFSWM